MHSDGRLLKRKTALPNRRQMLRGMAGIALVGVAGLHSRHAAARSPRVGDPAPPAVLVTLTGERIASQDLLGQVIILTFWATYCAPCRAELPLLSAYAERHAGEGLRVLGFCLDEPDQLTAVRRISESLSFPTGFLREDSAAGYGRIWRMPANFTIGRDGRLVENGWDRKDPTWTAEKLEQIVSPLLALP